MKTLKIAIAATVLALTACGGDADPKAGVLFRVDNITSDTTTANTTCQAGGVSRVQADEVKVQLDNKAAASNEKGTDLTVYQYSVDYEPLDGGPPIKSINDIPVTLVIPAKGTGSVQVLAFSEEAKKSYFNATTNTTAFFKVRQYHLRYTFDATTQYDNNVEAVGDLTLRLGNTFANVSCK